MLATLVISSTPVHTTKMPFKANPQFIKSWDFVNTLDKCEKNFCNILSKNGIHISGSKVPRQRFLFFHDSLHEKDVMAKTDISLLDKLSVINDLGERNEKNYFLLSSNGLTSIWLESNLYGTSNTILFIEQSSNNPLSLKTFRGNLYFTKNMNNFAKYSDEELINFSATYKEWSGWELFLDVTEKGNLLRELKTVYNNRKNLGSLKDSRGYTTNGLIELKKEGQIATTQDLEKLEKSFK